ncbi:MAG: hypothetical protein HFH34_03590 [Eubacterium sp.]|nr:hypothetical protein [Eubacterium sp.]
MKIKKMISIAMVLVLLLSGCASSRQSQIKYIGAAKAKSLALEAGGVSASQAEFSTVDLSERGGQDYYQVAFTAFGEDYYYDIDALTGVIIDAKVPAGSIKNEMNAAGDADGGETDSSTDQNTADPDTAGTGQTSDGIITEKQARIKALAHAGLSEEEVIFLKTELDIEDGRKVYEVEFLSNDTKEYDYEIDASSGDVVSYDFEAESAIPPAADRDSMISEQKAKELALAQVPGAKVEDILEFETDHEDGRVQYEGKIFYEGMQYEFEIDAYSGAFRSWEAEPLDGWE